jgi:hypothetical protein
LPSPKTLLRVPCGGHYRHVLAKLSSPLTIGHDTMGPPTMRHGLAPETLRPGDDELLGFLYASLPKPPVSTFPSLCCAADEDKTDRVSRLPDGIVRRVVSLLPAKDGARTTVLSSRWRGLWHSAPLVLADTHLLPVDDAGVGPARAGAASRAVTDAVSAALEAHPGPFAFVGLTCSFIDGADRPVLARWFQLLATKGVDVLVFVNRPWPLPGLRLPSSLFAAPPSAGSGSLDRRLGVPGHHHPPARRRVPQPSSPRPRLRRHGGQRPRLCARREPRAGDPRHLRKPDPVARSSRQPQHNNTVGKTSTTVNISHAPKLLLLGCLEPGVHTLQIGDTIIKDSRYAWCHVDSFLSLQSFLS